MEFPHIFAIGVLVIVYVTAQSENEAEEPAIPPQYPTYATVPAGLSFSCQSRGPGYYADPDASCQVWHWCLPSGAKYSFLCPNGTVFNQRVRVCDWWFNVDCAQAPDSYNVNDDLYKTPEGTPI